LSIADTHSLEQIESFVDVGRDALLQSVDSLIAELPEVVLTNEDSRKILHGQPIRCSRTHAVDQPAAAYRVRLYSPERKFLGVGLLDEDGGLKPERLRAS
jgi:tRNA pseudouridine55 synthase